MAEHTEKQYVFISLQGEEIIPRIEKYDWCGGDSDICLGRTIVTYEVPPYQESELRAKAIQTLNNRIKNVRIDAEEKIAMYQEKIDGLTLLEHTMEIAG